MPYVQRNPSGDVVALTAEPGESRETLCADAPEVIAFLAGVSDAGEHKSGNAGSAGDLLLADLKMIRVIEDVIDLLIAKNVIIFSELPAAVQSKILQKRGQREKLFGSGADIIGSDEGIL